ncbi:MAG: RNA methyltransferase [Candidatus Marsarchaeota archaeon]|nr:RNA methyltransferase [Candidatus Marsarchaeota archaeon]
MASDRLTVVFVGCETPENAGFLARVAKNFGFTRLRFVSPLTPVKEQGLVTAMHASDVLESAGICSSLEEAVSDADTVVGTTSDRPTSHRNVLRAYVTPREFADQWSRTRSSTALVFGREGTGLSNAELELCDFVVSIPTHPDYPSMNVSHSAAVILYELALASHAVREARRVASPAQKQRVVAEAGACLAKTLQPAHKTRIARRVLRSVLGRTYVSPREASTMIGLFRRLKLNLSQRPRRKGKG